MESTVFDFMPSSTSEVPRARARIPHKYKDDPRAAEVMAEEAEMRAFGGGGLGMVPEEGHGDGAMAAMFQLLQTQQEHHQRDR